jgi:hypothetical protein
MWQLTREQTGWVNQQVSMVHAFAAGATERTPPATTAAISSLVIG